PESMLTYDPEKEHVLELNSLSKSFNMAGWRVGMVVANQHYINAILKVKSNVDSGMFLPIQHAAIEALRHPIEWHQERNKIYEERKKVAVKIFDVLGLKYSHDQVGMFIWAKVPDSISDTAEFIDQILQEAHVFLTPGGIFGTNGERYVRLSLCSDTEILSKALERVRDKIKVLPN
ncbi:pyridoxal phosphate-dependent aminotransferase, partial [Bacteroidota bacterium]